MTGRLGDCLVAATAALAAGQLRTGEIATYRRIGGLGLLYTPSPCLSAIVLDALACLDPASPESQWSALAALDGRERRAIQSAVGLIRGRLRQYLAWQEESDATWCFYGRGSSLGPDAASTSIVSAALLADARRAGGRRARAAVASLARFRRAPGRYVTFLASLPANDDRRWQRLEGRGDDVDRVVNAEVLRVLALCGAPDEDLARCLLNELDSGPRDCGSSEFTDPACFAHALARAWTAVPRPDVGRVSATLVAWLRDRQRADGSIGGPLATALATRALASLDQAGDALDAAEAWLIAGMTSRGEWAYEPYLAGGHGSAAFTSALAVSALVACASARGGLS